MSKTERKKRTWTKNTKRVLVSGAALLALTLGGSYAWFTSEVTSNVEAELGTLKVDSKFSSIENDYYAPGQVLEMKGEVTNIGSLNQYVYLEPKIEAEGLTEAEVAGVLGIKSILPASGDYSSNPNVIFYQFTDSNTGKLIRYMYIGNQDGENRTEFLDARLVFNGEKMGNDLQGKKVTVSMNAHATNDEDEALASTGGFKLDEVTNAQVLTGNVNNPKLVAKSDSVQHQKMLKQNKK